jgi:hypothetical protein
MNIFVIVSENSILTTCLFEHVREFLMKRSFLLRFVFEVTKLKLKYLFQAALRVIEALYSHRLIGLNTRSR